MQEVEGLTPTSGTCPNDFRFNRPGYPLPLVSELENSGSEWWSVIAESLNIGSGVRLIKLAKLVMCPQKHYNHNKDERMAPGLRSHGSVPLSNWRNVVMRIALHTPPENLKFWIYSAVMHLK